MTMRGFSDQLEIDCGSDPLDASGTPLDTDNDGEPDNDTDDDGDGWSDEIELKCGTNPLDPFSKPLDRDDGIASCEDPDDDEVYVSPLLTPGVNGPEATWQVKHIEQYGTSSIQVYNRMVNWYLVKEITKMIGVAPIKRQESCY